MHHAASQPTQADLVNMRDILVEIVQATCHGEDGDGNEQDPGEAAHPGAVVQPIGGQEDGPHRQPTLIQLQQPLVVLHMQPMHFCIGKCPQADGPEDGSHRQATEAMSAHLL